MKIGVHLNHYAISYTVVGDDGRIVTTGINKVPSSADDRNEFIMGKPVSRNANRRSKRAARRNLKRYKRRRDKVNNLLLKIFNIDPNVLNHKEALAYRAKGGSEKLSVEELIIAVSHLCKRRGYNPIEEDYELNGDYLKEIEKRTEYIKNHQITIGEYLYDLQLKGESTKKQVFLREDYIAEFNALLSLQKEYYSVLTVEAITQLREYIYYQRPLKSAKNLVSFCDYFPNKRVAHRSNPIFQKFRVYSDVENLRIYDQYGRDITIEDSVLSELNSELLRKRSITALAICKLAGLDPKNDNVSVNYKKGLQGHYTYSEFEKASPGILDKLDENALYGLWHIIYSVSNKILVENAIKNKYPLIANDATELAKINFGKLGYSNMSEKAIKTLIPFLEKGYKTAQAFKAANVRVKRAKEVSNYDDVIVPFKHSDFNNWMLNKVANRYVATINKLKSEFTIDMITLSFDKLLLSGNKSRRSMFLNKKKAIKENDAIKKEIFDATGISNISNNMLTKYKLWQETQGVSPYQLDYRVPLSELLTDKYEIEHIIPLSAYFDNSRNNKTFAPVALNREKDNQTAYDYMCSLQLGDKFTEFINGLDISEYKKRRFFCRDIDIPSMRLRETAFSKKIKRITEDIIPTNISDQNISGYICFNWGVAPQDIFEDYTDDVRLGIYYATANAYINNDIIDNYLNLNSRYIDASQNGISLRKIPLPYDEVLSDLKQKIGNPEYTSRRGIKLYKHNENYTSRRQLHKETVYGKIYIPAKIPSKQMNKYIKEGWKYVSERNNIASMLRPEIVVKYPIETIKQADLEFVVDKNLRIALDNRLKKYQYNDKLCWENLTTDPFVFMGKPVKSVRMFTKLKLIRPLHLVDGKMIDYVSESAYDHVACYRDSDNKIKLTNVSVITAVQRVNHGIPVIIKDVEGAINKVLTSPRLLQDQVFMSQMPLSGWNFERVYRYGDVVLHQEKEYLVHSFSEGTIVLVDKYKLNTADRNSQKKISICKYYNDLEIAA